MLIEMKVMILMNISNTGINLIKSFEGCYLEAYRCPAGVWTIGWGTTEPVNGVKPHAGMKITQKQADDLLINHLKSYEASVNKLGLELNQNQFDALVSICYNCGAGIFKGNLLNALKAKNLNIYVTGSGTVLSQDPMAGTTVEEGTVINVTLKEAKDSH